VGTMGSFPGVIAA